jgi:hypothetical protein
MHCICVNTIKSIDLHHIVSQENTVLAVKMGMVHFKNLPSLSFKPFICMYKRVQASAAGPL